MTRDDRPTKVPEALDALNHLYKKMVDDVNVGDRTYNEGVLKMVKSYDRNSMMTNASSMHCFSKSFESSVCRGVVEQTSKGSLHRLAVALSEMGAAISRTQRKRTSCHTALYMRNVTIMPAKP